MKNIQKVIQNTRYSVFFSLFFIVGMTFIHPVAGMILAAILVLVVVPFLCLLRHNQTYAFVGALLFLTILRPLPGFIDSDRVAVPNGLYDRLLDLVWIFFVVAALAYWILGRHKRLRVWPASYWFLAGTLAVMLSIAGAGLSDRGIVFRDLFELYRGPYNFLVLLLVAQVAWDDEKLLRFLYKPFLAALLVVSAVTVIQGLGDWGASFVSVVYTPRFTESFFEMFTNPTGRGSGFFFLVNAGTFANSNWFGVSLGLMMPFLMAGLFLRSSRSLRVVVWVVTVATFVMILVAGSRAGLAMGTFSVFTYFLLWAWDIWRRPLVTDHSSRNIGKLAPVLLLMLSITILVGIASIRGDRYHGTVVALGGGVFQEIRSAIPWNEPSQEGGLAKSLSNVTVGKYANESGSRKLSGALTLIKQTWEKSPVIGFGPFKVASGRDYSIINPERAGAKVNVLGDTQYSVLFFRYGIIGTVVWIGFWIAVMWYAFRSWLRSTTPVQTGLARAVLATVPVFLLVSVAGAFFDSRQLATVFLLLIGVALSNHRKPDEETT